MNVVDIVKTGAKRQRSTLMNVVSRPSGPFSTVDQLVKNARTTAKQVTRQVGVGVPSIPKLGNLRKYRPLRR